MSCIQGKVRTFFPVSLSHDHFWSHVNIRTTDCDRLRDRAAAEPEITKLNTYSGELRPKIRGKLWLFVV